MTRHHPRHGLSLVEVLVALVVFATAALASLAVHTMAARQSARIAQRETLARHAANILDSLRASSCATVTGGNLVHPLGTITWTATPAMSFVAIQVQVVPSSSTTWALHGISPC